MKDQTIYVVMGSTGEYSDRSEWIVCAYTYENDAKEHVVKADQYAKEWHALTKRRTMSWKEESEAIASGRANPMDPHFSCDYTGTSYWYEPCELKSKFTFVEKPAA